VLCGLVRQTVLEVYEIVNWSEMGKAIPELTSFKEKLQATFTIC